MPDLIELTDFLITDLKVITVIYKASMKLQPSNKMYPSMPTAVMTPSARKALQTRRRITRGSYVSEKANRLSVSVRLFSTI